MTPSYALVTPVRDEAANLPRLAESVLAQEPAPAAWIVVDDGSRDGTREFAEQLARRERWIAVVAAQARDGALDRGRREGRPLLAFRQGIAALERPVAVVAKVDADVSFAPDYWARLVAEFARRPALGIAGGACHERSGGRWVRRRIGATAVWGATRAYRWECLDCLDAVAPRMGWDGLDEVRAQLRGWETGTLLDLPFRHHRPEHTREPGRMRAQAAQGAACWYMGYRLPYLAARSVYRAREDVTTLAMIGGYLGAALARRERHPEPEVRQALRRRQRLRSLVAAAPR